MGHFCSVKVLSWGRKLLRVPSVNPDKDRRIAELEEKLSKLRAVPAHRRSAEFVPEKIETIMEILTHLRGGSPDE